MKIRWLVAGAAALAGCSAAVATQDRQSRSERELAEALAGRTAGPPTDCISVNDAEGPQVIDGRTLLYRRTGRVLWRNDLESECPSLRPFSTIVIEVHGSQVCRRDLFRTIESGSPIPGAYCQLGKFTPFTKPKR